MTSNGAVPDTEVEATGRERDVPPEVEEDVEPILGRLAELFGAGKAGAFEPDRVVKIAAAAMPQTDHCGITLLRGSSKPRTVAWTDDLPTRVDELQYTSGEGPCLDASTEDTFNVITDLETTPDYPRFAPACVAETGVRSMLSVRLMLSGDDQAALNFYAEQPGAFDDLSVAVASLFSPFVSLAVEGMLHRQDADNLRTALQTSRQIGTAVGIIMARQLITSEDAFALLRQASSRLNRKLNDIALEVEQTGQLPHPPATPAH